MIAAALELVESWVGLVADPRAADDSFARYRELVAAGESEAAAADMVRESGCALLVRGFWRLLLARPPAELCAPYVIEHALDDVRLAAQRAGAIRSRGSLPELLDVVHVGPVPGAPEHVWICGAGMADEYGGARVRGVEGGYRTPSGYEGVHARMRSLVVQVDGSHVDEVDDGPARPVLEVYSLEAMVAFYGAAALP